MGIIMKIITLKQEMDMYSLINSQGFDTHHVFMADDPEDCSHEVIISKFPNLLSYISLIQINEDVDFAIERIVVSENGIIETILSLESFIDWLKSN